VNEFAVLKERNITRRHNSKQNTKLCQCSEKMASVTTEWLQKTIQW